MRPFSRRDAANREITLKDHIDESRLFLGRTVAAVVGLVLLAGTLTARLFLLQVVDHEHYITRSHDNRVKVVPLPPTRGLIYDRNGVPLAENLASFMLTVTPEQAGDIEKTIAELRKVIPIRDVDLRRFRDQYRRMRRFESIPLRFHLDEEELARFAVNRHRFPGVEIEANLSRYYPLADSMVHAVGYVGRINEQELEQIDARRYSGTTHIGKVGVEKAFEDALHGDVAFQHVEINAQGRPLRILEKAAPTSGANLYLTLDANLQALAEEVLGEQQGAIVAIDPNNGDVLALVSQPGYDPNLFVNGIDPETYTELQRSRSRPLFNRALRGQYPPGSTIKPLVGLAGLESGVTTASRRIFCPGHYQLNNDERKYHDWKRTGHGSVDLQYAIAQSCDVYFYDLALTLGIDRLHNFLSQFGLGEPSGIDIGGEMPGLLPSREWKRRVRNQGWYPGETLITGIGQGFNLSTPVQLASAIATLAARGKHFRPRVVRAIEHRLEDRLEELAPVELPAVPVINPANWKTVIEGMIQVVNAPYGTARKIALDHPPYTIAGKTGTAQVFGLAQDEKYDAKKIAKHLRDHSLFVAFAPAEAPRVAIAVIIENGGSGSAVAAPIARKVLDFYLLGKRPEPEEGAAPDAAAPQPPHQE